MQLIITRWLAVAALILLIHLPATPQRVNARNSNSKESSAKTNHQTPPKMMLLIVIDQFRADYLLRYQHLFGARGFKRLLARGAYFTNANYAYSNTYTAAGHSTIATGSLPSIHGIIANQWLDRELGIVKSAVSDDGVQGVGTNKGSSPHKLLSTTIGDQLRLSNNYQSKSIGVSLKDRSATVIAGRKGNAAYWFDSVQGCMVSSSYYIKELPPWVKNFNEQKYPDQVFNQNWQRKLPEAAYQIADRDDAPYEATWLNNTTTFPHLIDGGNQKIGPQFYNQFTATPFSSEMLAKFAVAALDNEALGKDQYPDLLGVSFSGPDLTGHMFGPYSQELQDVVVRMDDVIEQLLDAVDRRLGLDNVLIVLTADHGVAPIPDYSQLHQLGGGRINGMDLRLRLEKALNERYGAGEYIMTLVNHNIYLNEALLREKKLRIDEVEEFIGQEALKTSGIANYFTHTRLSHGQAPNTDLGRRVIAGFNAQRNGNVLLIVEPFVLIAEANDELTGTAHGSPYHYDTHVPVIISGRGIKPGIYRNPCTPSDIAPTVCSLLGVEPPSGSIGRVLIEAID